MSAFKAAAHFVLPLLFAALLPLALYAGLDDSADKKCNPVTVDKCDCHKKLKPDKDGNMTCQEDPNMNKCKCKSDVKPAGGHCIAANNCLGTWYKNQKGDEVNIDPNAKETFFQKTETGWDYCSLGSSGSSCASLGSQGSSAESNGVPTSSTQPEGGGVQQSSDEGASASGQSVQPSPLQQAAQQYMNSGSGKESGSWDGVGTEQTPSSRLQDLIDQAQANAPQVETQSEQPKGFLESTLERWGISLPGLDTSQSLTPVNAEGIPTGEPITSTFLTETPGVESTFQTPEQGAAPEAGGCGDAWYCPILEAAEKAGKAIGDAVQAAGDTLAKEFSWNLEARPSTFTGWQASCYGGPECGDRVMTKDNVGGSLNPANERVVAVGPGSPFKNGDILRVTRTDTGGETIVQVRDTCPECKGINRVDLTVAAARDLGFDIEKGVAPVRIERIDSVPEGMQRSLAGAPIQAPSSIAMASNEPIGRFDVPRFNNPGSLITAQTAPASWNGAGSEGGGSTQVASNDPNTFSGTAAPLGLLSNDSNISWRSASIGDPTPFSYPPAMYEDLSNFSGFMPPDAPSTPIVSPELLADIIDFAKISPADVPEINYSSEPPESGSQSYLDALAADEPGAEMSDIDRIDSVRENIGQAAADWYQDTLQSLQQADRIAEAELENPTAPAKPPESLAEKVLAVVEAMTAPWQPAPLTPYPVTPVEVGPELAEPYPTIQVDVSALPPPEEPPPSFDDRFPAAEDYMQPLNLGNALPPLGETAPEPDWEAIRNDLVAGVRDDLLAAWKEFSALDVSEVVRPFDYESALPPAPPAEPFNQAAAEAEVGAQAAQEAALREQQRAELGGGDAPNSSGKVADAVGIAQPAQPGFLDYTLGSMQSAANATVEAATNAAAAVQTAISDGASALANAAAGVQASVINAAGAVGDFLNGSGNESTQIAFDDDTGIDASAMSQEELKEFSQEALEAQRAAVERELNDPYAPRSAEEQIGLEKEKEALDSALADRTTPAEPTDRNAVAVTVDENMDKGFGDQRTQRDIEADIAKRQQMLGIGGDLTTGKQVLDIADQNPTMLRAERAIYESLAKDIDMMRLARGEIPTEEPPSPYRPVPLDGTPVERIADAGERIGGLTDYLRSQGQNIPPGFSAEEALQRAINTGAYSPEVRNGYYTLANLLNERDSIGLSGDENMANGGFGDATPAQLQDFRDDLAYGAAFQEAVDRAAQNQGSGSPFDFSTYNTSPGDTSPPSIPWSAFSLQGATAADEDVSQYYDWLGGQGEPPPPSAAPVGGPTETTASTEPESSPTRGIPPPETPSASGSPGGQPGAEPGEPSSGQSGGISCSSSSVVDCLNENGMPSSFPARKDLAESLGVPGHSYVGTAEQNEWLRNALTSGALEESRPTGLPSAPPSENLYAGAADYRGDSIVTFLKDAGQPSDFSSRAALAADNGIDGYRGTAQQNLQLLQILRSTIR